MSERHLQFTEEGRDTEPLEGHANHCAEQGNQKRKRDPDDDEQLPQGQNPPRVDGLTASTFELIHNIMIMIVDSATVRNRNRNIE